MRSGDSTRTHAALKPPPDRLYGRRRTHRLRDRQLYLLGSVLPRLRLTDPGDPAAGFAAPPARLWLEIGFGGGELALALSRAHPEAGLIACEVFEPGICSLLASLLPDETSALPGNLRLWNEDARALLPLLPPGCLDRVILMFPDPWPKARHAKRRFVHPGIVPLLASRMVPGAEWWLATDDPIYQDWVREVMAEQTAFHPALALPDRPPDWPPTRYEAKALRAGRRPLYWRFIRR